MFEELQDCHCGSHLMRGSRGDRGSGLLWKITKIYFFSNTGPDPLKNNKASKATMIYCRAIIGLLANRHLNGVPLVGR